MPPAPSGKATLKAPPRARSQDSSAKAPSRPASIILLLAWLILLAGLAATAGYTLMLPAGQIPTGATRVAVDFGPPVDAVEPMIAAEPVEAAKPEAEAASAAEAAAIEQPAAAPEPAVPAATPPAKSPATPTATTPAAEAPAEAVAGAPPQWQRFSQPFDGADKRPRIAIVLTGLGLSSATTEAAITQLPAAVTLSFTPYSLKLDQWVGLARSGKHEIMLDLPMEPTSYPDDDPGPQALLTALSPEQNMERLQWALGRADGYVGVATVMGSRFTASENAITPILEALKEKGLIFLDNRSTEESVAGRLAAKIGVASAVNDRTLDSAQGNRVAIDSRLVQLEGIARAEGVAVAMGRPTPVTIERLREWAKDLPERGFVLAPISAVVDRQRHHLGMTQSTKAE